MKNPTNVYLFVIKQVQCPRVLYSVQDIESSVELRAVAHNGCRYVKNKGWCTHGILFRGCAMEFPVTLYLLYTQLNNNMENSESESNLGQGFLPIMQTVFEGLVVVVAVVVVVLLLVVGANWGKIVPVLEYFYCFASIIDQIYALHVQLNCKGEMRRPPIRETSLARSPITNPFHFTQKLKWHQYIAVSQHWSGWDITIIW